MDRWEDLLWLHAGRHASEAAQARYADAHREMLAAILGVPAGDPRWEAWSTDPASFAVLLAAVRATWPECEWDTLAQVVVAALSP